MNKQLKFLIFSLLFIVPKNYFYCNLEINLLGYLQNLNQVRITSNTKNIIIKDSIKTVVILCSNMVTGGPENLCQIYASLKKKGFDVYFLWVGDYSKVIKKYKNGTWYLGKCNDVAAPIYKKNYNVNYLDHDVPLIDSTLIILPEVWSDFVYFFENAKKMIAWLSISNLHGSGLSKVCHFLIENKKLGCLDCLHTSQAPWVQKVLHSWGAESFLIGDYIPQVYFSKCAALKRSNSIAFFPRKGGNFAANFIKKYFNDFNYIKLENLNQQGMINALDLAKIYIDFGNFPGKDRTPREAVLRNCVIFIHNQGCATDFESFPLDDYFRFSEDDILNGTLYRKVQEVLSDYENMLKKQLFFKMQISQEYDLFEEKIQDFFGNPFCS